MNSQRPIVIGFPKTNYGNGPGNFLLRLKQSIRQQNLAKVVYHANPFHQIALSNIVAKRHWNRPYVLRIDGPGLRTNCAGRLTDGAGKSDQSPLIKKMTQSIHSASGIIFQSGFDRQQAEHVHGLPSTPIDVIPNGAVINRTESSFRKELNLPKQKPIIMCASSWRRWKRLDLMIEVAKHVQREIDIEMVVLGKNANPTEVPPFVRVIGHVHPDELYRWHKSADLFLHLAYCDNCPNSVVEAIANGLPVVCANSGGTPDIVERAQAGFVTQCDDLDLESEKPKDVDAGKISEDILQVLRSIDQFKQQIDFDAVDIDRVAQKYVGFLQKVRGQSIVKRRAG